MPTALILTISETYKASEDKRLLKAKQPQV